MFVSKLDISNGKGLFASRWALAKVKLFSGNIDKVFFKKR